MNLPLYKTVEPRIDFGEQAVFTVPESAANILYRQYPATSYSDNSISISVNFDRSYAISSKMYLRCKFRVTFNGTPAAGSRLILPGLDAPRFQPLMSTCQTLEVQLNNQSFSQKINWYNDALMRYNNNLKEISNDLSTFPSMPDYYQNYQDFLKYGSALNSLARVGESGAGTIQPRGGFPFVIISGNGIDQTSAVVEFETYEPLILSPLNWGHNNTKSFRNISNLVVNLTMDSNLARVWSANVPSSGAIYSSVTASMVATGFAPILELITLTPKTTQIIDPIQRYGYGDLSVFPQAAGTLAPGQSSLLQFNNITLSGYPSMIYIFLRRRDQDRTYATTDTYARIDSLSLTLGNVNGIFAQCSAQQLYAIATQNGYSGSWSEWSRYTGGVLALSLAKDLPMPELDSVGVMNNVQLQFEIGYTNIQDTDDGSSINYSCYLVVDYDGLMTITEDGTILKERNLLTQSAIAKAPYTQHLPYQTLSTFATSGGSFGSKLRNVGSRGINLAMRATKAYKNLPPGVKTIIGDIGSTALGAVAPRLGPVVKDAEDIYHALKGQGYSEDQIYHVLGKHKEKAAKAAAGAGYKGGKKLTKTQLKKLAL